MTLLLRNLGNEHVCSVSTSGIGDACTDRTLANTEGASTDGVVSNSPEGQEDIAERPEPGDQTEGRPTSKESRQLTSTRQESANLATRKVRHAFTKVCISTSLPSKTHAGKDLMKFIVSATLHACRRQT